MNTNGWIKLHRKCLDSGIIKNHKLWVFWTWCLLKATHKEKTMYVGNQQVSINPGQFIFGRKMASIETGLTERNIRTCLKSLINSKNVTSKTTNKYSIITIINWDTYQHNENEDDQQDDQQPTSNRPATDHIQEVKEEKKGRNTPPIPPPRNALKKPKSITDYINVFLSKKPKVWNSELSDKAIEFIRYRQENFIAGKRYKTPKGIDGLIRDVGGCIDAGLDPIFCIDRAMEKGWQAPDQKYFDDINKPKDKNQESFDKYNEENPPRFVGEEI